MNLAVVFLCLCLFAGKSADVYYSVNLDTYIQLTDEATDGAGVEFSGMDWATLPLPCYDWHVYSWVNIGSGTSDSAKILRVTNTGLGFSVTWPTTGQPVFNYNGSPYTAYNETPPNRQVGKWVFIRLQSSGSEGRLNGEVFLRAPSPNYYIAAMPDEYFAIDSTFTVQGPVDANTFTVRLT